MAETKFHDEVIARCKQFEAGAISGAELSACIDNLCERFPREANPNAIILACQTWVEELRPKVEALAQSLNMSEEDESEIWSELADQISSPRGQSC